MDENDIKELIKELETLKVEKNNFLLQQENDKKVIDELSKKNNELSIVNKNFVSVFKNWKVDTNEKDNSVKMSISERREQLKKQIK